MPSSATEEFGHDKIGLPGRRRDRSVRCRQEYGRVHASLGGCGRSDQRVGGTDCAHPLLGIADIRRHGGLRPVHGRPRHRVARSLAALWQSTYKTTWFWAFNHYPAVSFERDMLVKGLEKLVKDRGWPRTLRPRRSKATLRALYALMYLSCPRSRESHEDALESPLTELGLIRPVGRRDEYRFVRGRKPTLGAGVFCYAVTQLLVSLF